MLCFKKPSVIALAALLFSSSLFASPMFRLDTSALMPFIHSGSVWKGQVYWGTISKGNCISSHDLAASNIFTISDKTSKFIKKHTRFGYKIAPGALRQQQGHKNNNCLKFVIAIDNHSVWGQVGLIWDKNSGHVVDFSEHYSVGQLIH